MTVVTVLVTSAHAGSGLGVLGLGFRDPSIQIIPTLGLKSGNITDVGLFGSLGFGLSPQEWKLGCKWTIKWKL